MPRLKGGWGATSIWLIRRKIFTLVQSEKGSTSKKKQNIVAEVGAYGANTSRDSSLSRPTTAVPSSATS